MGPAQVGLRTENQEPGHKKLGPKWGWGDGWVGLQARVRQRPETEVKTEGSIVPRLLPWPLVSLAESGEPQGPMNTQDPRAPAWDRQDKETEGNKGRVSRLLQEGLWPAPGERHPRPLGRARAARSPSGLPASRPSPGMCLCPVLLSVRPGAAWHLLTHQDRPATPSHGRVGTARTGLSPRTRTSYLWARLNPGQEPSTGPHPKTSSLMGVRKLGRQGTPRTPRASCETGPAQGPRLPNLGPGSPSQGQREPRSARLLGRLRSF